MWESRSEKSRGGSDVEVSQCEVRSRRTAKRSQAGEVDGGDMIAVCLW